MWTKTVKRLRAHYEWLLFFSVPKLLHVYQLIQGWCKEEEEEEEEEEGFVDLLVKEIMFLIPNDTEARGNFRENIEVGGWGAFL